MPSRDASARLERMAPSTRIERSDPATWDPVTEFRNIVSQLGRFPDPWAELMPQPRSGFTPLADVEETDDGYLIEVELPGIDKKDVDIAVAGRRLTNAPEWSGRLWLEWTGDAGGWGTWSLRADSRWQSTVYFTPFNDAIQRQRSYGVLDVSAELRGRPWGLSVGAYVRNLTNADYITGTFSSPPPAIGGRPGDPRQAGIQLRIGRP